MKVFQEGPLAAFLSGFMDLLLLNVLWFVCSLPVLTLGASTCALYDVTMRRALQEDPPVVRTFFRAFGRCCWRASALFLLLLGAGFLLAADLWCALHWETPVRFLIVVVILAAGYFYLAVLCHVFPVLAYFDTGVRESIRRTFLLSMSSGVSTVTVMVLNLLPIFLLLIRPDIFGQLLFLYLIIGFGGIARLCSSHLVRVFRRCPGGMRPETSGEDFAKKDV